MERYFMSRQHECKGECIYCFGKWDNYIKFPDVEVHGDHLIIYPNCDGDFFDDGFENIMNRIHNSKHKNVIFSVSTKFIPTEYQLQKIQELNSKLKSENSFFKLSVSFSCSDSIERFEKNTSVYNDKIELIKRINEHAIPYFTIIKPILPFIDIGEYKRIVDDTIKYCSLYVLGDLYVNPHTDFFEEYIKDKMKFHIKDVNWNGCNGKWLEISDDGFRRELINYIISKNGVCCESDKEAIMEIIRRNNNNEQRME